MNVILLSGGSGKRLWPLSNNIRSKQFIKIFRNEDGGYESMIQRVYRQIINVDTHVTVTIATSREQIALINNQLGEEVDISAEPCRKDTFPAAVLALAYLHDVKGISEEEGVIVCPVDSYVEDEYFVALKRLSRLAEKTEENLVLMGIEPTYPSEKYGYILPVDTDEISSVSLFKEKPDKKTAEEYISRGALWNSGVFAFRLGFMLQKARELIGFTDYADLYARYEMLKKVSFDYAVVENEKKITVMRFSGQWKDLGTWNTLTEVMKNHALGQAIFDETCENTHVVNELNVPVLCMGLKDMIISASPDGILVSDKIRSSYIKPFVDALDRQIMFVEKSWGSFCVLDIEENSMTIKVILSPGHSMKYHSHMHRDETWNIISGEGNVILDGMKQKVKAGDVVTITAGCRHTIFADTELHVIEVQKGMAISVYDKVIFELEKGTGNDRRGKDY